MAESAVFEIPKDVSLRLHDLSASQDVPFSTALATATAALLHKYSCEGTLAIRTTNPGRSESWVGLLPVCPVPHDPSFEQMLARARQILPNRPEGPEVEILLPPGLHNESQPHKLGFRKESRGLTLTLDACLTGLAGHLQILLRGVTNTPSAPISTINILGDQETRQILVDWNQTDCGYPQACLPELFEEQVRRTPNAVALIQGTQKLTYSQLDEKANRLANYLRKRGVGPEVLVGFCMEQSLTAVVAVLGILKAGGAYVPVRSKLSGTSLAGDRRRFQACNRGYRRPFPASSACRNRDGLCRSGFRSDRCGEFSRAGCGHHTGERRLRLIHIGFHREAQRRSRYPSQHHERPEDSELRPG